MAVAVLYPGSSGPDPGPNPSLTQTRLGKMPRAGGHGHPTGSVPDPQTHEHWQHRARRVASQTGDAGKAGAGWELPERGPATVAAEALVASGGASAEQGPPPGASELGREAGGGAPAGEGLRTVGPGQVAGALAGPAAAAGDRGGFS